MPVKAPKKQKSIGKVVHYYDKIGVAIVELAAPLSVGDTVCFKKGEQEFTQQVTSLQVDHEEIAKGKKKQVVGMKVEQPVKDGAVVVAA